jgi:tRNA1Val (adenine37-N6)-methyltransferase
MKAGASFPTAMNPHLSATETLDDLLHGELKLIQPRRGYRYSVDALLLAAFALPLVEKKTVLDLGTGSGVVALILAARGRPARVVGVEYQESMAGIARRNAEINAAQARIEIIEADVIGVSARLGAGTFDLVVTNPPFRALANGRVSDNPQKAIARHELKMTLPAWLAEAKKLVAPAGSICVVYPTDQENRLDQAAAALGLHPARRQFAIDRPHGSPKLILLDLRREPGLCEDLAPIAIETPAGKFSLDGYR